MLGNFSVFKNSKRKNPCQRPISVAKGTDFSQSVNYLCQTLSIYKKRRVIVIAFIFHMCVVLSAYCSVKVYIIIDSKSFSFTYVNFCQCIKFYILLIDFISNF